jgi:hypothetical protein
MCIGREKRARPASVPAGHIFLSLTRWVRFQSPRTQQRLTDEQRSRPSPSARVCFGLKGISRTSRCDRSQCHPSDDVSPVLLLWRPCRSVHRAQRSLRAHISQRLPRPVSPLADWPRPNPLRRPPLGPRRPLPRPAASPLVPLLLPRRRPALPEAFPLARNPLPVHLLQGLALVAPSQPPVPLPRALFSGVHPRGPCSASLPLPLRNRLLPSPSAP